MPDWINSLLQDTLGLGNVVSPIYLLATVATAWIVFRLRGLKTGFLGWLLPREIWAHKSTRADIALFLISRVMSAVGLIALFTAVPAIATMVADALPFGARTGANLSPVALGFVFWVFGDFAVYLNHRAHHQIATLWPMHAVHHSAEVMTPITAQRQHPLALLIGAAIQSVILGAILGLLVGTIAPDTTIVEIAGVNAFTVVAIMAMANFHHSHIWICYGRTLEHLLISPAQHQVHHSNNPAHFNKNYGNTLAIWDWMFGTLYIPQPGEAVTFGLTDPDDAPLMTHRLGPLMLDPLRRMLLPRR